MKRALAKKVRKERHKKNGNACSCGAHVVAYSFHIPVSGLAGRGNIQFFYEETGPHTGIVHVRRDVILVP